MLNSTTRARFDLNRGPGAYVLSLSRLRILDTSIWYTVVRAGRRARIEYSLCNLSCVHIVVYVPSITLAYARAGRDGLRWIYDGTVQHVQSIVLIYDIYSSQPGMCNVRVCAYLAH